MSRLWVFLTLLWLVACTSTSPEVIGGRGQIPHLVWPSAPEPARIELVGIFNNAEDLGLHKSFSQKLRDLLAGSDDRSMIRPYSIAATQNLLAVADPNMAVVHLFNTQKKTYNQLKGSGDQSFGTPIGVTFGDDKLFVADSELNVVFILDRRFNPLETLDNFQRPTGLAFDPVRKRLYIADTLAHEIHVYDLNGNLQFKIGERGEQNRQFNYPSHLSFADDRLFVNDTMNFRIQVFDPDGRHLQTFGKHGDGSGYFAQPKGVAVDSEGHVYVADAMADRVQVFGQDGTFLLGFGNKGEGPGAFRMPTGLAIWEDMIYVVDSHNQRVQIFRYLREEP